MSRNGQQRREAGCWVSTRIYRLALALLLTFLSSAQSLAQGCAACYTTAASGGSQTIHALRGGILLLLVPPMLIFAGIVGMVRKWDVRKRLDR